MKNLKKRLGKLGAIVMLGAAGLSVSGCGASVSYNHPVYRPPEEFKIEHEKVIYQERIQTPKKIRASKDFPREDLNSIRKDASLTVVKPDGRIIEYWDSGANLTVDGVLIKGEESKYFFDRDDEIDNTILDSAQVQYTNYLQKIKDLKIKQGLDNLN